MRICNRTQNLQNRVARKNSKTGVKGIYWSNTNKAYVAFIRVYGERIYLGAFKTADDAGKAYDEAARKYFGEFARTNF